MLSVLRRGAGVAAITGVLVLGMASCGTERATTVEAQPTATATTRPTSDQNMSTVTLRRVGGVAGFNDVLKVESDGTATLTSRGRDAFTCRVKPEVLARVTSAAEAVEQAPESKPKTPSTTKAWPSSPPVVDQLNFFLTVGDREIRMSQVDKDDRTVRDLFTVMNDILTSASMLRAGEASDAGACTR